MDPKKKKQPTISKRDEKKGPAPKKDSTSSKLGKAMDYSRKHEDTIMSDSVDDDIEGIELPVDSNLNI